jgi:pimeloyl-ACP methyl ester carboxylesterase
VTSSAELLGANRRMIAANGLDFEVFEAGDGPRLALLLHGFPQNAIVWRHLIPTLVDKGYRIWAVNQRGFGDSSRPTERSAYALELLLADIAGLIDAAGAAEVALIGHDWGGFLGYAFAARRLRPLERLVVFNAPHPACFARTLREVDEQKRRSRYIGLFQTSMLPELLLGAFGAAFVGRVLRRSSHGAIEEEAIALYRDQAKRPGALTAMLNWYRVALPQLLTASDLSTPIDVPVLLVWGDRDHALSRACLDGAERYAPKLTIERLPRGTHWGPEECAAEATAILQRHL